MQTYDVNEFDKLVGKRSFTTDSYSFSRQHVLRGFHGDKKSWKLIQCLRGSIYFAVIDLRYITKENPVGNVFTAILNDINRYQVLVPAGCVNAHLCLSQDCIFSYKLSDGYVSIEDQLHVKWNDPQYKDEINWGLEFPILSTRDT